MGEISLNNAGGWPPVLDRVKTATATEFLSLIDDLDRDNASNAIGALTNIALETRNPELAETCRNVIGLILAEYATANEGGGDGETRSSST